MNKRTRWKIIAFICLLLLSGCSNNTNNNREVDLDSSEITAELSIDNNVGDNEDKSEVNLTAQSNSENGKKTNSQDESDKKDESQVNEKQEDESILPPQMKELPMYSVDGSTSEVKATVQLIPMDSEVTADLIVQLFVDDLADNSYTIGLKSVKEEGNYIVVNFEKDLPPVSGVNKESEVAILDAIAQSIIDNLVDCKGVVYRVDDKSYVSDNFIFDYEYIYLGR